ncbi:hypothetical protein [Actinocorallia populi]|uniref:hypothetical protein n=1 Tax=Actinocorallia populi TaxID=2079200 RepID=UPI0013002718|nr:hypothetical protein [Actinocorallia populi]
MNNFDGEGDRGRAYASAFAEIREELAETGDAVTVAGFTEITGRGRSVEAMKEIADALSLSHVRTVAYGRTALPYHYECTTVASVAAPTRMGRIFIDTRGGSVLLHDDAAPEDGALFDEWCTELPEFATADYHGIVYAVVDGVGIGFVHNRYGAGDERHLTAQQIPDVGERLARCGNRRIPVYIGGNFNVDPRRRGAYNVHYRGLGAEKGTTYNGHKHDYWYSNVGDAAVSDDFLDPPVAEARAETLGNGMSDHCATLLAISP